jgi:protein-S-isoprenylcysteine O-methyltransferase Ste14
VTLYILIVILQFGDYMWIPFVFSLQAVYLVDQWTMPVWYRVLTLALFLIGYYIFRESNYQKFQFRQDPRVYIWGAPAKTISTSNGRKLLVSGWWGRARKVNYLGDILMAISMSMPCGFHYFLPWLYPVYLTILLINRAKRDNDRCQAKYGKYWDEYCKTVPYTIIPYIY